MRRQRLDVEDRQPVALEHAFDGVQRQVRVVLVVDGVELVLLEKPEQVWKLEGRDAVGLRSAAKPPTKSLMSGTWASTLLAATRSTCFPRRRALPERDAEEALDDVEAERARRRPPCSRSARRRTRDAGVANVAKQVAVVGGDLADEARGPSANRDRIAST